MKKRGKRSFERRSRLVIARCMDYPRFHTHPRCFCAMILLDLLESLPPLQLFLLTVICGLALGALMLVGVSGTVRVLRIGRTRPLPIRDALISSLSAMFALMVAFSAAGIWSDAIQARGAVQREANSIENIVAIASSFPDEFREEVHREILRYARRAGQRDWPAMRRRETPCSNVASRHECSGFDH